MNTLKTLEMALEAFEIAAEGGGVNFYEYAKQLRQQIALEKRAEDSNYRSMYLKVRDELAQLQQREWQGLTDEEIVLVCAECAASAHRHDDINYARAIEAKLKDKNNDS